MNVRIRCLWWLGQRWNSVGIVNSCWRLCFSWSEIWLVTSLLIFELQHFRFNSLVSEVTDFFNSSVFVCLLVIYIVDRNKVIPALWYDFLLRPTHILCIYALHVPHITWHHLFLSPALHHTQSLHYSIPNKVLVTSLLLILLYHIFPVILRRSTSASSLSCDP